MKWFALAVMVMAPVSAHAEALNLVCQGTALHVETSVSTASAYDNHGNYASGDATNFRNARSEERFRVQLDGSGTGRVRPPVTLNPPISRGKGGWWDLEQLTVTDNEIRGRYSLNMLNHPSVVIDRKTGDISVKGMGLRFDGTCEKAPDEPEGRKF